MEVEYYIKKWLAGELSEDEKKTFEKSSEYQSIKKISSSVHSFKAPEYDVSEELEKLRLKKAKAAKVVHIPWMKHLLRTAAVLTGILIGYFFLYINISTSVQTLAGEKSQLLLPDSSQVMLNTLSEVSFKERKWENSRQVKLNGEAFFKVAKGSKFDVITTSGIISVLGTQFNVKNRIKHFEVICYEGLVEIQLGDKLVQLPSKHSYRIINDVISESDSFEEQVPSWLNNESSFQSVPFGQVIKEFERQYDVTVTTNKVNLDQLFTGRFDHTDQTLAIQEITVPLNLSYEIVEKHHIILSGEVD